ncbi:MAG TPA: hypothetical protein EYP10_14210 [Armatimonadetes bacterium]|nr:hypothetical protein [Armatimonadota bacterium]
MATPLELDDVQTISIAERPSKVGVEQFAQRLSHDATFEQFVRALPRILAGDAFKSIVDNVCQARRNNRPVILMYGAHVIKCGLSPILIQLMEESIITALATNGAGAYHDVEIALYGCTSEDVTEGVQSGTFGMAREPVAFINAIACEAAKADGGLGEAIGQKLLDTDAPYVNVSLLAQAKRMNIPLTIHIAIGTDVNHLHPDFDAAAWGQASYTDFRIFCNVVKDLTGGVIMNFGSAVLLPLIFEKAISVVRNLGYDVREFTGVTFDFIRHYRATRNPVDRANELGGCGYYIIGHHELLIPLLAQALLNACKTSRHRCNRA